MAVVFDFDDTLLPDSTTALLAAHGIDTDEFWKKLAPALVAEGYDPPLAYLRLILDRVGEGQPLGSLRNEDLVSFGASLDTRRKGPRPGGGGWPATSPPSPTGTSPRWWTYGTRAC